MYAVTGRSHVQSAGVTSGSRPSAYAFIDDAERQLELARMELRSDQAVVYSYRAALRTAGAMIHWTGRGRKRMPTGSAWDKLRKLNPEMSEHIAQFQRLSRLASRADMGLEKGLSSEVAQEIYERVCGFVDRVREEINYASRVA